MNSITLIGRLSKDPDLKALQSGTVITNFTLAVDRPFSKDKATDFIQCICFGKLAENVVNYLTKGRQAAVQGYLQIRSYEKDGQKHYVSEVVANTVEFLGSKSNTTTESIGHEVQIDDQSEIPF